MIDLYTWTTPNGRKISIALEEMELPYRAIPVDIREGEQKGAEFLKISPSAMIPAIVDGDMTLMESGAILLYLAQKSGKLAPPAGSERYWRMMEWLMWQMGNFGPILGQAHHFLKYAPQLDPPQVLPYAQDRYRNEVARLYGVLDKQLAENRYVAGDFYSIADMALWGWCSGWEGQEQTLDDKPHFARWLEELGARPGVIAGRAVADEMRNRKKTPEEERRAQEVMFGFKR